MPMGKVEGRLRVALLLIAGLICIGTPLELLLTEHYTEIPQLIPFGLCGLGLVALVAALIRPGRGVLRALRVAMTLLAGSGLLGIVLHLVNNYAFELEIRPGTAAADVLIPALKGANPLLAPGVLALAGLLAILATYYHPLLGKRAEAT